ncbi:MAG: ATP-binding protein [Acidobacteriota bacterium]|jgi:two-component system nitrogen regulation sensor histidine kinase NtrY|nr:ATP-binding protein [Acidobacteriota bacterium]
MGQNNIRGIRLVILGVAIFFVLYAFIRIFMNESENVSPLFVNSTTLIIALWTIIILFSLTFLFMLIRNIVKMYFGKSPEYAGGPFKKRLVFFFIAFSIVPTLLLFFFGTNLLNRGIERWFNTDIDAIMRQATELEKSYYEKAKQELRHFSDIIASDVRNFRMYTYENRIWLRNEMRKKMKEYRVDIINIYDNHNETFTLLNPIISLQEYKNLPLEIVYRGLGSSDFMKVDSMKGGELIRSGVAFDASPNRRILLITGKFYPEDYIDNLKRLTAMVNRYTQLKSIKDPVKTTYLLLFIFITILIVFAASWLGFYLAKGISVPIEKLSAAAAEITRGNLDVRIDYESNDEFNSLVTEFNRMAADLREHREKLNRRTMELSQRRSLTETILKNITSGVIAVSPEGEIADINPEARRMLAFQSRFVEKKQFAELFADEPYQEIRAFIQKAFNSKFKIMEKEIDIKIRGRILNLAMKITQVRNPVNKKFAGILLVLTDLTELIRAQRLLVWREVAKRIAHEIKNPLTPIQISSQRILKSLDLPDAKFRKVTEDSLHIILQELDSISKLAEEFSNYARLPKIQFTRGDINLILEKLVNVYSSIYANVDFDVNLDVEMPIIMKIDTEQIKRIFVNIIDNAVDAMNKKGRVEIVTRYIKESQFARIEIADEGPGISDVDKLKLFTPYFSQKSTGTGLGLAIAHNIIEEHNGQITVVDNSPHGSRFVIEIPA